MKNPRAAVGTAALLAFMLAGCAGQTTGYVGREEFESKCATCHGVSAKGDGPQSSFTATKPADLTLLAKGNGGIFPTQRVYDIIDGRQEVAAHGPRTMPIWGREFQVDVPEVPKGAAGIFDFRQTSVHTRIQALIDYLITLQVMK